jgi:glutamate racemase
MEFSSSDNRVTASQVVSTHNAKHSIELLSEHEIRRRKASRTAPIGVFDSGVGGLTILTALQRALPQEDFIYIGDTAHCPYGTRSEAEVVDLSLRACRFLVQRNVKLIVVACNTASQSALNILRATYPVPFVGVVPAVKPAARITRSGRIGVIATNQAARAAYLQQLIDHFAEGIEVEAIGSPEMVTLAEQGEFDGPHVEEVVKRTLQPLLDKGVDVIVLGCTHFPALRPTIERLAGKRVQVIDSGAAIARRTYSILESEDFLHPDSSTRGNLEVWCSGEPEAFSKVASKLLGYPVTAQQTAI